MVKKNATVFSVLSISLLVLVSGCKNGLFNSNKDGMVIKLKSGGGEPIAQVGNVTLTVEELNQAFMARQGSFAGAEVYNTDKKRNDFVENQVLQEAMFQEAVSLGYMNDPEIKQAIKKTAVQAMMRDKLESMQKEYEPTQEEMKEHYDNNQNLYKRDDAVKISYVAVPFGKDKNQAKKIANEIYQKVKKEVKNSNTRKLGRIAKTYQKSETVDPNVDVSFDNTGYMEKKYFESKFGANNYDVVKNTGEIGEFAPLMEAGTAYLIIMKTGFRKELNESFEEAKEKIAKRLAYASRGKIYDNFTQSLQKKYDIKIFRERIADLGKIELEGSIKEKEGVAVND